MTVSLYQPQQELKSFLEHCFKKYYTSHPQKKAKQGPRPHEDGSALQAKGHGKNKHLGHQEGSFLKKLFLKCFN